VARANISTNEENKKNNSLLQAVLAMWVDPRI